MAETTKKPGRKPRTQSAAKAENKEPEISAEMLTGEPTEEELNPTPPSAEADISHAQEEPKNAQTFTLEQVQAMLAEASKKAAEEAVAHERAHQAAMRGDEMVTIAYLAEVSPESELVLPGYGSMRPQSYIEVPKKEFGNKFMSTLVRKLIDKRHLIVLDGLTKDERERWNCDYKDGEVLDERTFDKMLDYPTPQLAEIFEKLCPEHQRFVARRMITAKEKGDNRISVSKAKAINDLSKRNDPNGMLKPVMEAFSAEITG